MAEWRVESVLIEIAWHQPDRGPQRSDVRFCEKKTSLSFNLQLPLLAQSGHPSIGCVWCGTRYGQPD